MQALFQAHTFISRVAYGQREINKKGPLLLIRVSDLISLKYSAEEIELVQLVQTSPSRSVASVPTCQIPFQIEFQMCNSESGPNSCAFFCVFLDRNPCLHAQLWSLFLTAFARISNLVSVFVESICLADFSSLLFVLRLLSVSPCTRVNVQYVYTQTWCVYTEYIYHSFKCLLGTVVLL